jgi:CubicO group peptidase (beta-lactamase class C family)
MTRRDCLFGSLALALRQNKIDEAVRLIESRSGTVAAASLYVKQGSTTVRRAFGKAGSPDAIFLLASITKPMTATALMQLAERGALRITDPVQRFLPEFRGGGREKVLIRHLLTHTSGLPDMLPENVELRKHHAPLTEFVAGTCRTPLLFEPGSEVRYQSMGILLAATIVERVAGAPLPAYLAEHVYRPLGLKRTSLGLGGRRIEDTMQCQVDERNDYDWNSVYWRNLASPWGGAHSTAEDVGRFLQTFADPACPVLRAATSKQMISNQTAGLKQRWGLGLRLGAEPHATGCSVSTFGHSGSTGTLAWHDPERRLTFVLLCTKPSEVSGKLMLRPVSDVISASYNV